MAGQGRDQEHRRLGIGSIFGEMDERREGGGHDDLLSHFRIHVADAHLVEVEGAAVRGVRRARSIISWRFADT